MECPDRRLKKKNKEKRSYYGRSSGRVAPLKRTHTECQALKFILPALDPITQEAGYSENKTSSARANLILRSGGPCEKLES